MSILIVSDSSWDKVKVIVKEVKGTWNICNIIHRQNSCDLAQRLVCSHELMNRIDGNEHNQTLKNHWTELNIKFRVVFCRISNGNRHISFKVYSTRCTTTMKVFDLVLVK
jgi:hypothetical protein